jgi:hypothetical protein
MIGHNGPSIGPCGSRSRRAILDSAPLLLKLAQCQLEVPFRSYVSTLIFTAGSRLAKLSSGGGFKKWEDGDPAEI